MLDAAWAVAVQPLPKEYVMVAVPGPAPVMIPDSEPAVAISGLPLLHIPPPVPLFNVVVWPVHIFSVPVITPGAVFTVTVVVAVQPVPNV